MAYCVNLVEFVFFLSDTLNLTQTLKGAEHLADHTLLPQTYLNPKVISNRKFILRSHFAGFHCFEVSFQESRNFCLTVQFFAFKPPGIGILCSFKEPVIRKTLATMCQDGCHLAQLAAKP
jgi:hypothetical protein